MDARRLEWLGLVRALQRPRSRPPDLRRAAEAARGKHVGHASAPARSLTESGAEPSSGVLRAQAISSAPCLIETWHLRAHGAAPEHLARVKWRGGSGRPARAALPR